MNNKSTQELIRLLQIKDDLESLKFYYSEKLWDSNTPHQLGCRIFGNLSHLSPEKLSSLSRKLNLAIAPVIKKYIDEIDKEIKGDL